MNRGQSNVVGVALLLGIAVISMGTLTAAVGVIVDSTAAEADAERVATDFDSALEPVAATGPQRGQVTFSEGSIQASDRTIELRRDGTVVERIAVDALVFESGDRRVAFQSGAIIRGRGEAAWMASPPPITVDEDVLVIGIARLGDDVGGVSGSGGVTASVETDVGHDRRRLGDATFTVAIETAVPAAWERWLTEHGADVERRGGNPPTVVATFEGDRTGYLVVHDLRAEVDAGG
ncbi:MAG: hypothetical protein ACI8UR_000436 [Natronomonas sp.]|jgi:hypothetical protein|uniref:DUF7289 family protein n=1 Tax=Natronomonas sp. TaxID=2184060 RepID=UPI003988AED1